MAQDKPEKRERFSTEPRKQIMAPCDVPPHHKPQEAAVEPTPAPKAAKPVEAPPAAPQATTDKAGD